MDYEKRERQRAAVDQSATAERHSSARGLAMVPRVTRQHGERFAYECAKLTDWDVTICDVFAETEIIEWPDGDTVRQERFR